MPIIGNEVFAGNGYSLASYSDQQYGQTFVTEEAFDSVSVLLRTTTRARASLFLHEGHDVNSPVVASVTNQSVRDGVSYDTTNGWMTLDLSEPLPAGSYHFRIASTYETTLIAYSTTNPYPSGNAFRVSSAGVATHYAANDLAFRVNLVTLADTTPVVKRREGTTWVDGEIKRYNGTEWVTTTMVKTNK